MRGKKITIKRVGSIYVFKVNTLMRKEELHELQKTIMQQLNEGCVVLPAYVELLDVEPNLETFVG